MKIANITAPGTDHIKPPSTDIAPGFELVDIVVNDTCRLATEPVKYALKEFSYVEAAMRAEGAGCCAAFVNSVADYGLPLLRGAVGIPVFGAGQTSIEAARNRAGSFSIVTVWPASTRFWYDRVLEVYAAEDDCTSVRYVLEDDDMEPLGGLAGVVRATDNVGTSVVERILQGCRDAVEKDGAKTIVLGCTCMSGLQRSLQDSVDVEVIDPLHEAYIAAQASALSGSAAPAAVCSEETAEKVRLVVQTLARSAGGSRAEQECGEACSIVA